MSTNDGTGTVLVGTGRMGDFVHTQQGTAGDKDFRNVSVGWYPQTQSYDEMMDGLQRHYDRRLDIMSPMAGMKPGVNDKGGFVLIAQGGPTDGAEYTLTEHALIQLLSRLDVQTTFRFLLDDIHYPTSTEDDEKIKVKRDKGDAETLVRVLENAMRHYAKRRTAKEEMRFRTYDDTKEVQAVLTKQYSTVDNRWFLKIVNEMIPGGRYSHFTRADDNTIYGNVLIPDSIRKEDDSDYGGMLSLGNCEIGKRKIFQFPSVFRAICMNGCIWDQSKGVTLSKRHRGIHDLDSFKASIVANLQTQIPLAHEGIDRLLNTRAEEFKAKDVSMARIFVAVAEMFKLAPRHLVQTRMEWQQHERQSKNLFGVVNALTRAGQKFDNETWSAMDAAGGALTKWNGARWNKLVERAKSFDDEEVAAAYSKDKKYLASVATVSA
jgi:hypothetical protein